MKKALLFLADGFEEVEALAPLDILRRGEVEVLTVSVTGNKKVKGSHNIFVEADILMEDLSEEQVNADAYILPGGMPGAATLSEEPRVQELLLKGNQAGNLIAAICAAPMALGNLNLLNGKEAICYPSFEKHLKGAKISEKSVVKDGNVITAKGVGVAFPFGYMLLEYLVGKEKTEALKEQMIWKD